MAPADPTPAEIARRLTAAQRRALLWLPAEPEYACACPAKLTASLRGMAPLASGRGAGLTASCGGGWWHVTPLGLAVRAELQRMAVASPNPAAAIGNAGCVSDAAGGEAGQ